MTAPASEEKRPAPPDGYETWLDYCLLFFTHTETTEHAHARAELSALRAALAERTRERDEADNAFGHADDERERLSDALIEAHRALGGDGEWCAKPGQTCVAGETGDLAIDVPALAERLTEGLTRAKSDAAACAEAWARLLDEMHATYDTGSDMGGWKSACVACEEEARYGKDIKHAKDCALVAACNAQPALARLAAWAREEKNDG